MRNRVIGMGVLALAAAGCVTTAASSREDTTAATVRFVDAQGQPAGIAVLTEAEDGVRINVNVRGLPPGTHGLHVHENGVCDPPDFTTAGGHYNPTGRQHGTQNPQGPHAGDLPNLTVDANGAGTLETVAEGVSLSGQNPLLKQGGTALVVHATADDHRTDPSGNSGARIACGVVTEQ
ncbi:MAG TPA: superoxide dismutase family protein [Longimicrobiaceae bacterium]|nr:superoxide dismutase family protein [Longimicrobiaceae bacterium]